MLLVHHNQPQLLRRGKHSRARADNDPCLSPADAPPFVKVFPRRQPRVQYRRHRPEAGTEPVHHLRGQGNLRHKNHSGPAHFNGPAHQADEHLCLAAARHAMEQEAARALLQLRQDNLQRLPLGGGQLRVVRGSAHAAARAAQNLLLP